MLLEELKVDVTNLLKLLDDTELEKLAKLIDVEKYRRRIIKNIGGRKC